MFSVQMIPQLQVLQSIGLYGDTESSMGFGITLDSSILWQVKEGRREVRQKMPLLSDAKAVTLVLRSCKGQFFNLPGVGRMPVNKQAMTFRLMALFCHGGTWPHAWS